MMMFVLCLSLVLKASSAWNILEIGQTIVFAFLFTQVDHFTSNRSKQYLKPISFGLLTGAIIISAVNLFRWSYGQLDQSILNSFLISGTFNYTSIYLYLGLVIAPENLGIRANFKFLLLGLFFLVVGCFQSRGVLLVGVASVLVINFGPVFTKSRLLRYLFFLVIPVGFFILQRQIILNTDTNHIFFSILDFERNTSNLERLSMILDSIDSIIDTPFGWGVGNTSNALSSFGYLVPHAHSTFPQWFIELGYFGLVLSCYILYYLVKNRSRSDKRSKQYFLNRSLLLSLLVLIVIEALQYNIMLSILALLQYMFIIARRSDNAVLL